MTLTIHEIQSGQFYKTQSGAVAYVVKILFEDYLLRWSPELVSTDHIVIRYLDKNKRYDYPYSEKYCHISDKFVEAIDLPLVFKNNVYYIDYDDYLFTYDAICGPAYVPDSIISQCKPYKFKYRILIGAECSRDPSNFDFSDDGLTDLIQVLTQTLGFKTFVFYKHLTPGNVGGVTTCGYSFWFQHEQDYNLAKLSIPLKDI